MSPIGTVIVIIGSLIWLLVIGTALLWKNLIIFGKTPEENPWNRLKVVMMMMFSLGLAGVAAFVTYSPILWLLGVRF